MIRRTAFFPIHWGIKRGQSFPCLLLTRMLQHKHQQKVQRVLSIAGRFLRPSDLLESLSAVIDEATRHQLGWLDTLGEPLAGEPAEAAYARRDKEPSPVSPISTTIEEPEATLAVDDPVRLARNRFHAALVEAFGLGWWRMSEAERMASRWRRCLTSSRIWTNGSGTGASVTTPYCVGCLEWRWRLSACRSVTGCGLRHLTASKGAD